MKFYNKSIKNKLFVDIFAILSAILIGVYTFFILFSYIEEKEDNKIFAKEVVTVLSQDFAKIILLNDLETVTDITTKLKVFSNIEAVYVYNKNRKIIYSYVRDKQKLNVEKIELKENFELENNLLEADLPLIYAGKKLGYVKIFLKVQSLEDILKKDFFILFLSFILISFIAFYLSMEYSKNFTKPILEIVQFLSTLDFNNITKERLKLNLKNEFKILIDEINSMLDRLSYFLKQEKISSIAFEISDGMMITDKDFKVIKVNKNYSRITGYEEDEVVGQIAPFLKYKLDDEVLYREIMESLKTSYEWSGEVKSKKKSGEIYYLKMDIKAVLEKGEVEYYVLSFKDITANKRLENQLNYLKEYDPLTGFLKKEAFLREVSKAKGYSAIIYLKIKDLAVLNAVYGYEVVDFLIKKVSKVLKLIEASCVGRLGSSYFAICIDNLDEDRNKIKKILEIINAKLSAIHMKELDLKIVMGVYLFKNEEPEKALKKAYIALEKAIKEDKRVVYYNEDIREELEESFNLYYELKKALEKREFVLYYQPQYNDNGKVIGAEALIRWKHPKRGLLTPYFFIDIVENSDLVYSVGDFVIEEAVKTVKELNIKISVNVHPRQFKEEHFVDNLIKVVEKYGINPGMLKIELLESSFVKDLEITQTHMEELKKYGFTISIDDFGTGYSSLKYIVTFPIDQIKIDQAFVMKMFEEPKNISVIKTIVTLSSELNLDLIAEGVETRDHFEKLKEIGVKYFQGYYFSKPISFEEFIKLV